MKSKTDFSIRTTELKKGLVRLTKRREQIQIINLRNQIGGTTTILGLPCLFRW